MKKQDISFLSRLIAIANRSKGYVFLTLLYALALYLYLKQKQQKQLQKQKSIFNSKVQKVRAIMREIAIEANLSLSVVHLKYKEKSLGNPQTKAQHLL